VKFALPLFFLLLICAPAQTNLSAPANSLQIVSTAGTGAVQAQTGQNLAEAQRIEQIRMACIQNRRRICGKILKVLPDGVVVDSGYTNLMRNPLNRSWLLPGTVVAARATNLVEENKPDSICIGLIFLSDLPRSRNAKPRTYDYVNLEAYPAGQYTYSTVGDIHRTVRKFSSRLSESVRWKFDEDEKQNAPTK